MVFRKKVHISTLEGALELSWKLLRDGVRNFRNPFHRPILVTIDSDKKPQGRVVILREFSEKDRTLICHCDVRSPKIAQIQDNPNVSWLFYDPEKWLQLRLSGKASVHADDGVAESQWERVLLPQRINYCAEGPPGSLISKPTSGLPDLLQDKASILLHGTAARKNFAAIVCQFDEMDWLLLKLTGHMRAKFYWNNSRLEASWVIP